MIKLTTVEFNKKITTEVQNLHVKKEINVTGCILALLALQGQVHSTLCTRMLIWSRALAVARAVS